MKRTPAIALAGILLAPLAGIAGIAQAADAPPPPPPGMHGMPMDNPADSKEMQADLKLTPDQQAKLKTIFADAQAKHEAVRKEVHDKVAQVLTPEQLKKWEARQADRMDRRADRMERAGDRMERRAERMKDRADRP